MSALTHPVAIEATRPGPLSRLIAHCRRSLPPLSATLVGTVCWTAVMAASALQSILMRGWETPEAIAGIVLVFALGAAVAFPPALFLARFVSHGRPAEPAFAAMFLALAVCTIGATAGVFALDYRRYYAEWHEDFGTITWAFQFVFTAANALVQFAVLGVRLFFPVGFIGLFVAAFWFARRPR